MATDEEDYPVDDAVDPADYDVDDSIDLEPVSAMSVGTFTSEQKLPKEAIIVALFGAIIIGILAVGALAYNSIVHGGGTDGLTTIAAVVAGGLVAAFGAHQSGKS